MLKKGSIQANQSFSGVPLESVYIPLMKERSYPSFIRGIWSLPCRKLFSAQHNVLTVLPVSSNDKDVTSTHTCKKKKKVRRHNAFALIPQVWTRLRGLGDDDAQSLRETKAVLSSLLSEASLGPWNLSHCRLHTTFNLLWNKQTSSRPITRLPL